MGKVIMFANQKGGVGKTSSSFEVGYILSEKHKVLLVDLDAQCNLTHISTDDDAVEQSKNTKNIYTCLTGSASFEESIVKIREKRELYLLPGSRKMLSQYFISADDIYLLKDGMQYIPKDDYDYIIIDVGPEAGQLMTMAMLGSDYIVAVTTLSKLGYSGVVQLVADLRAGREHYKGFDVKPLGILINSAKSTNVGTVNRERYEDLAAELGAKPFKTEIKNSCVVDECKEFAMALSEYKPSHDVTKQYKTLAKEIEKRVKEDKNNG